jgi:hypothetical protein
MRALTDTAIRNLKPPEKPASCSTAADSICWSNPTALGCGE